MVLFKPLVKLSPAILVVRAALVSVLADLPVFVHLPAQMGTLATPEPALRTSTGMDVFTLPLPAVTATIAKRELVLLLLDARIRILLVPPPMSATLPPVKLLLVVFTLL